MKTLVGFQQKAADLAESLESLAEEKLRDRETHTAKKLGQAMSARRDGYTAKRAAAYATAIAALDAMPPSLAKLKLSKARLLEIAGQHGKHVSNGYHGYLVDDGVFRDMSPEAVAVRALTDKAAESPEIKKRQELEQLEAKLHQINVDGFFPTPREVIERMALAACIKDGDSILEPSAGKGDIIDFLAASTEYSVTVVGYERIHTLAEYCRAKGYDVRNEDFLQVRPEPIFDRVLMNPPFEKGADIDHVRHAFGFLKPDGILVSVMSAGTFYRSGKKEVSFQGWLADMAATVEDLPAASFAKAFNRTGVSTKLVRIVG